MSFKLQPAYIRCVAFFVVFLFAASFVFAEAQTISLDLKGMDVVEVLKTLASKGDMNLVVGSNVRGRVTMFLNDVDINDAFDIILAANNLAIDKQGDIIYVMPERDYELLYGEKYGDKKEAKIIQLKYAQAVEVQKALNQIKTKIGKIIVDEGSNTIVVIDSAKVTEQAVLLVEKIDRPTETLIIELNYAVVADLKEKIESVLTKGVGTVQIDDRTNKIFITDLKENIPKISEMVSAFDSRLQQVLIDARIMEITLNDEFQLGVDWEVVTDVFQDLLKKDVGIKSNFGLGAAGAFIPGGEIIIGAFGVGDYAAMVQALKTVGDSNILSSPRITVMNNEEAKILVGKSEPYATNTVTQGTSTTTTGTNLSFIDIGVKLFVTPTINKNGFVSMKIRPEVSSSTTYYTYGTPETKVPIVQTTQAETSVMVKDGSTIIIAGLIKDQRSSNVSKVPLLGDIPYIGEIFKKTTDIVQKTELVIFITPRIISGEVDYIKVPESPPRGEDVFTVSERPAFDRRKGVDADIGYLKEEPPKKEDAEAKINLVTATPQEYFYVVKRKILKNLNVPKKDPRVKKGDKVKVSFDLYSGGNLVSKPKTVGDVNSYLSLLVIGAIEASAPFPTFPLSIKEVKKDFVLEIVYDPDATENK